MAILLLPLSWIFGGISYGRRKAYQFNLLKSYQAPVPILIIGNISVGGTGKTPLLISIVHYLTKQGLKVGVVSRGYGGQYQSETLEITPTTSIKQSGDETALIVQQTQVPLFVGKSRVLAVQHLLKKYSVDCILSDDGLQHYALKRDIEVVVIDAQKRFGNQFLLPAGSLRESIHRLKTVDALISRDPQLDNEFKMDLKVTGLINLKTAEHKSIADFKNQSVIALAGIGNPQQFYQTLLDHQVILKQTYDFPDHYAFCAQDIQFNHDSVVIMTAKDAVKCLDFATSQHWYLGIEMEPEADFFELLDSVVLG